MKTGIAMPEYWQDSQWLGVILLALLVLAVGWLIVIKGRRHPYVSCRYLLTDAEHIFYRALKTAVPDGVRIMAKVRLGDVITCSDRDWHAGHGPPISAKHLDFVLVDESSTRILGAIELDDKSHVRRDRRQRDKFVDAVMRAAGVPLLRIPVQNGYDRGEIGREIRQMIRQGNNFN